MKNLNFMSFMEETATTKKATTETKKPYVRKPTVNQVKFYHTLCKQRRLEPMDTDKMSFEQVSKEIDRLKEFYPANEAQIDLIEKKVQAISKAVETLNFNDEQISQFEKDEDNLAHIIIADILRDKLELNSIISTLTGGREGTASNLIEKLIKAEKYFEELQPITNSQIESIVGMFFCPDIDFESYGLERQIVVDEEEGLWRKPTPQEFAIQIEETFSRKGASDFINQNSTKFYNWKKTRIRPGQIEYIQQLESQLADDSKLREIKKAVDQEGNEIEIGTTDNVQVKGRAYVPHEAEQLIQLSIEDASKFINQLKSELAEIDPTSLEGFEEPIDRAVIQQEEALAKEYKLLDSMMYKLEAIAGYSDEELHASVTFHLVTDVESAPIGAQYIREFIAGMLESKAITYLGVLEIASECETLQKILLNM